MVIIYFMVLAVRYYRNLKKIKIILKNIKDLKGFDCFSEEKWQELEDNYIYFDEVFQKNEKGLIFLRKKKAIINERDHLPDFLRIDVVDEEMVNVWLTKRRALFKNNLLDGSRFSNKMFLPFKIDFSKPWYYVSAACLVLLGLFSVF